MKNKSFVYLMDIFDLLWYALVIPLSLLNCAVVFVGIGIWAIGESIANLANHFGDYLVMAGRRRIRKFKIRHMFQGNIP